ncbi:hypothetical protein Pyn_01117 [Prunus yedoensis var. nudiflora]|uniref:Uncharacterized protein n=1 Tax=Prunus yedoensis var. nudiflora TaxID=2094558 RepID=A0A314XHH3_PRUYE|nr:hypothetical protein Pyn_01117 [Prunus yedoensis var. nudiflora]
MSQTLLVRAPSQTIATWPNQSGCTTKSTRAVSNNRIKTADRSDPWGCSTCPARPRRYGRITDVPWNNPLQQPLVVVWPSVDGRTLCAAQSSSNRSSLGAD